MHIQLFKTHNAAGGPETPLAFYFKYSTYLSPSQSAKTLLLHLITAAKLIPGIDIIKSQSKKHSFQIRILPDEKKQLGGVAAQPSKANINIYRTNDPSFPHAVEFHRLSNRDAFRLSDIQSRLLLLFNEAGNTLNPLSKPDPKHSTKN